MQKRWKPKNGDTYWYIDLNLGVNSRKWYDHEYHRICYETGNCFKEEREANIVYSQILKVLKSMPPDVEEDKPKPKLTIEVFESPLCPSWAEWAALDKLGHLGFYESRPSSGEYAWYCKDPAYSYFYAYGLGIFDASDWEHSLIKRPEKETLPDWCKEGDWVYHRDLEKYGKIKGCSELGILVTFTDLSGTFDPLDKFSPARPRPYNTREMRALVGKVIDCSGYTSIVDSYDPMKDAVAVKNNFYSADELLRRFTINGELCGVLEHLEEGEWVK